MNTHTTHIGLVAGVLFLLVAFFSFLPASSQADSELSGWAWSDTIGWISLNCSDLGTCSTVPYRISVDGGGTLSGYAWSEHIGWVSANTSDLSGCPSGTCSARLVGSGFQGWMKALSAEDGWDGWISLSGSGYGLGYSNEFATGYAWGSDVVGWVDYSAALQCIDTAGYYCDGDTQKYRSPLCTESTTQVCGYGCSAGACVSPPEPSVEFGVSPKIVMPGRPVRVHWNSQDTASCTVTGSNDDSWSGTQGNEFSSNIQEETSFTLECVGLDDSIISETATVVLNPNWRER